MGNQQGFSVVKVLIIIALFSVLMYGFTDYMIHMQKSTFAQINKSKRMGAHFQLERLLLSQFAVRTSSYLPENDLLRACAFSEQIPGCAGVKCCPNNKDFPIALADLNIDMSAASSAGKIAQIQAAPRLSGPESNPVLYSEQGIPNCTQNCAYSVATTANAHCPGEEPTCLHAEHIVITLHINPVGQFGFLQKETTQKLIYYVNRNYPPIATGPTGPIAVANGGDIFQSVSMNSGHPSEKQSFAFTTCESDQTSVATIDCTGFAGAIGNFRVIGKSVGSTQIRLQVSDGQPENSLSQTLIIPVVVY